MKLLHAEGHPIVARGVCQCLEGVADVSCANCVSEAVLLAGSECFDGYILALDLPDFGDGLSLIQRIRQLKPEARIIVFTRHDESQIVRQLSQYKVEGAVHKSESADVLRTCVCSVFINGELYFSPFFERLCGDTLQTPQYEPLTVRELQIIQFAAEGDNTKDIASKLFLSENTVETHRRRILTKLRARNIAEAVAKAYKMKVIG